MKPRLTLVRGKKAKSYRFGMLSCTLVELSAIPNDLDALLFEEDTYLVLTVDGRMSYRDAHPVRMMTTAYSARPHPVGSLIVKGRSWYGVTLDLDGDHLCKAEWVKQVYRRVGERLASGTVRKLGMHLLGNVHGRLGADLCAGLVLEALKGWTVETPCTIWLAVPPVSLRTVRFRFEEAVETNTFRE